MKPDFDTVLSKIPFLKKTQNGPEQPKVPILQAILDWYNNRKIGEKITMGFISVAMLSGLVVCIVGVVNIVHINNQASEIYENELLPLKPLYKMQEDLSNMEISLRDTVIGKSDVSTDHVQFYIQDISNQLADYAKFDLTPAEKKYRKSMLNDLTNFMNHVIVLQSEFSTHTNTEVDLETLYGSMNDKSKDFSLSVDALFMLKSQQAKAMKDSCEQAFVTALILMLISLLATVGLSILLGIFIARTISSPLNKLVKSAEAISVGDLEVDLENNTNDEAGILAQSFAKIVESIRLLKADVDVLISACLEGRLDTRVEVKHHQGAYLEIIDGVNKSVDAIVGPLNVAADYVDKISSGQMPEKITEEYHGDFRKIKNNLNTCIDAINGLIADANMLADAAADGRLSVRAQTESHQGDFRRIIEGVNHTLDSFVEPIKESAEILNEMAKGNLKVSVTGDYKGDFAQIKSALNETITAVSGYINEISAALARMSNGDLNVEITSDYKGDFALIKDSINQIIGSFNDTLQEIRSVSDEVAAGASQVSEGSEQLSAGATEQASVIEQLTASFSQIASQTKQNALNADKAYEITSEVKTSAQAGDGQMKQMLTAMEEIKKSSASVKKIIKVINDIAFQTNILSLNAAVEAARAGQSGKGFAVVADEVRNLAVRSSKAADETASLIESSIKKSELGMGIAVGTANALTTIVSGAEKAAGLVGEISMASNEQATGIAQVNRGIDQVAQVIQTNSATAEESAASSEELSSQAEVLKSKIDAFILRKA